MRRSDWGRVALVVAALSGQQGAQSAVEPGIDTAATDSAATARAATDLARRVLQSADHGGSPFAIVDKQTAVILVYRADGTLAGASPVLLGQTPGDQSVAGVGERTQQGRLLVGDRTTPAGRFVSEPGHNLAGEPIVWIDYDAALAIHRLRPGPAMAPREQRLASGSARDKRVSAGCVVVPEWFYDAVVQPVLGRSRAVVYVMPEQSAWTDMFRLSSATR